MKPTDIQALQREASAAARNLRSRHLDDVVRYLDALAADIAAKGMDTKDQVTLRQRQGEHRAIKKISALLSAEDTGRKRNTLSGI